MCRCTSTRGRYSQPEGQYKGRAPRRAALSEKTMRAEEYHGDKGGFLLSVAIVTALQASDRRLACLPWKSALPLPGGTASRRLKRADDGGKRPPQPSTFFHCRPGRCVFVGFLFDSSCASQLNGSVDLPPSNLRSVLVLCTLQV